MAFAARTPDPQPEKGKAPGAPKALAPSSAPASFQPMRPTPRRQAPQQYVRAQVETASPTRLIVLLYDGAIRFCSLAIEAMQKRDLETQNTNLIKAQRIIGQLMSSLDRKAGGEVAENLIRVYVYMLEQLVHANLYDQVAPVKAVQKMLAELRDSWREVDRLTTQAQGQGAPANERLGDRRA